MPPLLVIFLSFFLAKAVLVVIVLGTTFLPEISVPFYHPPQWPFGYDSSSSIFLPVDSSRVGRVVAGLFRWDTVYFVGLAERGEYVWEQEWAFGPGWPMLIRHAVSCISHFLLFLWLMMSASSIFTSFTRRKTTIYPNVNNSFEYLSF